MVSKRKSYVSAEQLKALEATSRGEVVRTFNGTGTTLTCASVGSKALWNVLHDGLIANGPRTENRCTMVLTERGASELKNTIDR